MANDESHYPYSTSVPAGVVSVIIFASVTGYHTYLLFRKRTWFCIPLVIGGVFESVGYVGRVLGHYNPESLAPYILQALLILLAPILFAASVYMILGRIIRRVGAQCYPMIRVTWITKIFVGGDIFCFLAQALGGGMLAGANTASEVSRGQKVILFGLVLQIVIFGFFLIIGLDFHKKLHKKPTATALRSTFRWQWYMGILYIVSVLITFRNLFRVIEYAIGKDGYLLQNEWPIYVLDALPMATVLMICVYFYEPELIVRCNAIDIESMEGHQLHARERK